MPLESNRHSSFSSAGAGGVLSGFDMNCTNSVSLKRRI